VLDGAFLVRRIVTVTGVVQNVVEERGFAFLSANGLQYFVHFSACPDVFWELQPGDKVTFTPTSGPKGPRAEDIKRA
jgi:cold shock CspA family protein